MRNFSNMKLISLLLALVMIVGLIPTAALAAEVDEMTVVVSVEGLTLGQGMYVEPHAYTLSQINELVGREGYGPYTKETLTAAMATLALFLDQGVETNMTGNWDANFYLSKIKDLDDGEIDIPAIIGENGGPTNEENDGNDDEWLGEFDYSSMSGWMITVNNNLIPVGAASYGFEDYRDQSVGENYGDLYVVRWQFSSYGYGADLGFDAGWGMGTYFSAANKDALYAAYAMSDNAEAKAAALPVMENLTATQQEVEAALAGFEEEQAPQVDVATVLRDTMAYEASCFPEPAFGTGGGEWVVLSLARGEHFGLNDAYFAGYYDRIVETVNTTAAEVGMNGALHTTKSTENSRLILALSAIGKDARTVGDWNLIAPYDDFTWITKQGINGPVFALIALDTHNYETTDPTIRQQCVDYILSKQTPDGGWAFFGNTADPDMTGMTLQALAKYKNQPAVAEAAEKAFGVLSTMQRSDGGYASWGSVNAESIAQVIVATTAWGINPATDLRFVKENGNAVSALLGFYDPEVHGFRHVMTQANGMPAQVNAMATDQACYALVSYQRLLDGKTSLYDMTDVTFAEAEIPDDGSMTAIVGLPSKVEHNAAGFNATVSVNRWSNEEGFKLIDFIVTIPANVTVEGVTASNRLSGGNVVYFVEEATGKLRVVYFDANENADLNVSGTEFPAELFTIQFGLNGAKPGAKLDIALTGMSAKRHSDSLAEDAMVVVNTASAAGSVEVVQGITFSAITLYQGDGVDIIPENKKAVAVAVTGIAADTVLSYNDGANEISFLYSPEISAKTGISTYVALVDATIAMEAFVNAANYTLPGTGAEEIIFGDANGDGVINAQDALAAVDTWLRKGEEPTDTQILVLNVNGDSRINTFDALGIVEAFVNGTDYGVVTKACSLSTNS